MRSRRLVTILYRPANIFFVHHILQIIPSVSTQLFCNIPSTLVPVMCIVMFEIANVNVVFGLETVFVVVDSKTGGTIGVG